MPSGGKRHPRSLLEQVSLQLRQLRGFPLFLMFSFNGNLLRFDFCHQPIFTNLSALRPLCPLDRPLLPLGLCTSLSPPGVGHHLLGETLVLAA